MKILSFDIESCTGSCKDASLCSFGYVLSDDNFNVLEKGDILVNPAPKHFRLGKPNEPPKITLFYQEDEFRKAPKFRGVYEKIKSLFSSATVAYGFAVGNDVKYLNNACEVYRLPLIEYEFFDVQKIVGFFDKESAGHGLGKLGEKYGIEFFEHKSEDDAFVTMLLLKTVCEKTGKTLKELLDFYGIVFGKNSSTGVTGTFSLAEINGSNGLTRTKSQTKILLTEFLDDKYRQKRVKGALSGKRFCFNEKLEREDIFYSRKLISNIFDGGGKYTLDLTSCNIYVKSGDDDNRLKKVYSEIKSGKRIKIISQKELLEMLGELKEVEFDDVSLLIRHAKNKAIRKLKNKQKEKKIN